MTAPTQPGRSNGKRLLLVGVLLVALAGAAGLWYLFLRPAAPAAVLDPTSGPSRAAAASAASAAAASQPGQPSATSAAPSGAPAGASAAPASSLDGTWAVNAGIGKFSDFSGSFVGYRVQEQLASVGANTAAGRTPDVTGTFTLSGTSVTAGSFTARLTALQSDDRGRDGRVQDALNTKQVPNATFTLSSPIALGSLPGDGQEVQAAATGKLTIRGVTRDVQVSLTTRRSGATLTIKGALDIKLADYGIPKPTSFAVLSISDSGTVELQLQLTRS